MGRMVRADRVKVVLRGISTIVRPPPDPDQHPAIVRRFKDGHREHRSAGRHITGEAPRDVGIEIGAR